MNGVLPRPLVVALVAAIVVAQYLCGLATVTSASRMAFAFARDGGLPFSHAVRWVCPKRRSPAVAIWMVAVASLLFTIHTPVYATITAVCTIFLYLSYVLPTALGAWAYGRTWTAMGPWDLGRWYRPLAVLSVVGCVVLIVVGDAAPQRAIRLGRGRNRAGAGRRLVRHCPPSLPRSAAGRTRPGAIRVVSLTFRFDHELLSAAASLNLSTMPESREIVLLIPASRISRAPTMTTPWRLRVKAV